MLGRSEELTQSQPGIDLDLEASIYKVEQGFTGRISFMFTPVYVLYKATVRIVLEITEFSRPLFILK